MTNSAIQNFSFTCALLRLALKRCGVSSYFFFPAPRMMPKTSVSLNSFAKNTSCFERKSARRVVGSPPETSPLSDMVNQAISQLNTYSCHDKQETSQSFKTSVPNGFNLRLCTDLITGCIVMRGQNFETPSRRAKICQ